MRNPYVWAPINIGDWNTATQGLTLVEQAIVMKVLLDYWERGEFPERDRLLRLTGLSWPKWQAMQGRVGDALMSFVDRSGFMDERVKAAEITAKRREAANNRWERYRRNATQGLDANAPILHMTTTTTEETYTDRAQKLTRDKGLGNQSSWAETVTPLRPNGKLRH